MKASVLQPVDSGARKLARALVRASRFAALATLDPATGDPLISRVSVAASFEGRPVILVSELSAHTRALLADPRCSLLFGEPGEGDPLAFPRISVSGRAERIERGDALCRELKARLIARNPAAEVYADFADFHIFLIDPTGASLNAGFARAYAMTPRDILDEPADEALKEASRRAEHHMNADHADAVSLIARRHIGASEGPWRIVASDATGFEVEAACGARFGRIEFRVPVRTASGFRQAYADLAGEAPATPVGTD